MSNDLTVKYNNHSSQGIIFHQKVKTAHVFSMYFLKEEEEKKRQKLKGRKERDKERKERERGRKGKRKEGRKER